MMDALLLDMSEDSYLAKGWSLMLIVHNRDMFLPSISIASDFVGQKFTFHTYYAVPYYIVEERSEKSFFPPIPMYVFFL